MPGNRLPIVCFTVRSPKVAAWWGFRTSALRTTLCHFQINADFLTLDLSIWSWTETNGVWFATRGWQQFNSNISMWQKQSVSAANNGTAHTQQGGRDPSLQYAAVFAPIGVARESKGASVPQKIFRKYSLFVLERRFSKQKCYSPKIKHFGLPHNFLSPSKFLGWLRHCLRLTLRAKELHAPT